MEASLLPVCNRMEPSAISDYDAPPDANAPPTSLEIPRLGFSLRALIDRQAFSFCEFARATPADLPNALDDELRDWVENIFFQFRKLELMLGCVDASTPVLAPASRRPRTTTDRSLRCLVCEANRSRSPPAAGWTERGATWSRDPSVSARSAYLTRSSDSPPRRCEVMALPQSMSRRQLPVPRSTI